MILMNTMKLPRLSSNERVLCKSLNLAQLPLGDSVPRKYQGSAGPYRAGLRTGYRACQIESRIGFAFATASILPPDEPVESSSPRFGAYLIGFEAGFRGWRREVNRYRLQV